jgi:hypothetical protein
VTDICYPKDKSVGTASFDPFIPKNLQHVDPTPVDTLAPLSWIARSGYYIVQNKIFRHKVSAMQQATRLGLKPQDVIWVFNDNAYDSINWKDPVHTPLWMLYRMRAQQLREKYDYLVLSFSGGGDSTNVLDSFVLNNIRLDEVMCYWPRRYTNGKYKASLNTDAENFVSEWDYLIEPKLQWLKKTAPNIKITILDPHEHLSDQEPNEDFFKLTTRHSYLGLQRFQAVDDLLLLRQMAYKNCALITGVNPPIPIRVNRHFMISFEDSVPAMYGPDFTDKGLYRNIEYFYWTPDLPEIASAQAHALLDDLRLHPQFVDLLHDWRIGGQQVSPMNRSAHLRKSAQLRRWIKSVLYPTYDHTALQVDKNTSPIYKPEWYAWFYKNNEATQITQAHDSAVAAHQNMIDPDFFICRDNVIHDYYVYRKLYHVGDI